MLLNILLHNARQIPTTKNDPDQNPQPVGQSDPNIQPPLLDLKAWDASWNWIITQEVENLGLDGNVGKEGDIQVVV